MPVFPDRQPRADELLPALISNTENWFRETGLAPLYTSGAWTTANLAVYTPILVPAVPAVVGSIWLFHGASAANNLDLGIYAPDAEGKPGTRIWSNGSVAQSGTGEPKPYFAGMGYRWVPEGLCYLACAFNGNTGTVGRLAALTTDLDGVVSGGIFTEANAFPLPASATPNTAAVAVNVPIIALQVRQG